MNRLIEELDRACPGFMPDQQHVGGPQYIWMADFVRHVIREHVEGNADKVRAAFDVIEGEIANNGPYAELAIIGFLEDMQNGNLHESGSDPTDFRVYLGPHSVQSWEQLNGFWQAVGQSRK